MNRLTIKKEDQEHHKIYNEKKELLGEILYDSKWEQFVFCAESKEIKLASDCLDQISNYCKNL